MKKQGTGIRDQGVRSSEFIVLKNGGLRTANFELRTLNYIELRRESTAGEAIL